MLNGFYFIITVALLLSRPGHSVRNELMDAVIIADAIRVKLLLGFDTSILSSNHPLVSVDVMDENFGRTAIMVQNYCR